MSDAEALALLAVVLSILAAVVALYALLLELLPESPGHYVACALGWLCAEVEWWVYERWRYQRELNRRVEQRRGTVMARPKHEPEVAIPDDHIQLVISGHGMRLIIAQLDPVSSVRTVVLDDYETKHSAEAHPSELRAMALAILSMLGEE